MTPAQRKHLREAERIVRTVWNHMRGINTDGSIRSIDIDEKAFNWRKIEDMVNKWKSEDKI